MKKFFNAVVILLTLLFAVCLAACSDNNDEGVNTGDTDTPNIAVNGEKILVAYFSWSGNTEGIAQQIAEETGADVVEITAAEPYSSNYSETLSRAQEELDANARPTISENTVGAINMENYEAIFIGYPIWCGEEPMIIRSFFEDFNGLSGKKVYLFSTSSSSGGTTAYNNLKELYTAAQIGGNIHLTSSALNNDGLIAEWIEGLDLPTITVNESVEGIRVNMTFSGEEIYLTLVDNAASRDLASRLREGSMTLSFSDYAGSEKIAYPEPKLNVNGLGGYDPTVGDLTIYKPWGNLAAFYKDTSGYSSSLVHIGRIEGIEKLAAQNGSFDVTLSLAAA